MLEYGRSSFAVFALGSKQLCPSLEQCGLVQKCHTRTSDAMIFGHEHTQYNLTSLELAHLLTIGLRVGTGVTQSASQRLARF